MRSLRSASMGSISAWLPSRRSTLHQMGGLVITCEGQVRSASAIGWNGRYLTDGSIFMGLSQLRRRAARHMRLRRPGFRTARVKLEFGGLVYVRARRSSRPRRISASADSEVRALGAALVKLLIG